MIPAPTNTAELSQILAGANARKEKIERVNLAALNRIKEHTPEDMTVTVEAGITLAELQQQLGQHRQWLAIDPPHPESATIADIINANTSGPRRFGYGTIRDFVLGLTAVLADGTVIHSGGKVVKNVAGYDLMKLFIGGKGSLGVVVEATFKLRPLPERETFVSAGCKSLDEVEKVIESIINSEVTPAVLDLHGVIKLVPHPLSAPVVPKETAAEEPYEINRLAGISMPTVDHLAIVLGFAGTHEEVEWQLAQVKELGFTESASLDYETRFWSEAGSVHRLSVLPSKLIESIRKIRAGSYVARAGNGVAYHRDASAPLMITRPSAAQYALSQRLKDAYDPNHIFPDLPL